MSSLCICGVLPQAKTQRLMVFMGGQGPPGPMDAASTYLSASTYLTGASRGSSRLPSVTFRRGSCLEATCNRKNLVPGLPIGFLTHISTISNLAQLSNTQPADMGDYERRRYHGGGGGGGGGYNNRKRRYRGKLFSPSCALSLFQRNYTNLLWPRQTTMTMTTDSRDEGSIPHPFL